MTRIVSSRAGDVETRATGQRISSSTRRTYLMAGAGRSAQERAPLVEPDHPSTVTVMLAEQAGKTLATMVQTHDSVASRDAHIGSGMERGMRETLDRLDAFVSTGPR